MDILKGVIQEVYIPINNNQDTMLNNKIGFKIKINNEIFVYEEEQNEFNSKIYKDDKVVITKQIINNQLFVDIDKSEGEEDE